MTCQPLEASARPDGAGEAWSEVDLGTFFDVSLDLLVVRELDGTVVKASASWATLLGYRPDEIEGRGLLRLIHPEDVAATRHSIVEVETRRPGDPVLGQVNRYRHKHGHYITLEWRAQRHGDRIYAVARDVTDKVAAERDLIEAKAAAEAASHAKSDFLANMSHEIRTPMNGVLGMAELLSKSELDSRQKTFVDIMVKSGNALLTIINDILDFSKIDAGQLKLRKSPFDPVEAIEDHQERAQGIPMGCDQNSLAAQHAGQDLGHVIGPDAGAGVLEAFATRRRHIIGPAPDVDLLLAPFLARIILVEAGQIAVIAFVQRLVTDHRQIGLADAVHDQVERVLGADQDRSEGDVEFEAGVPDGLRAGLGFFDAEFGEIRILPACEQVFQVPFALAVADKDERSGHDDFLCSGRLGSGGLD